MNKFVNDERYSAPLVKDGRKLMGFFTYGTNEERTLYNDWHHPDKNGKADCSSFVWLVMKRCGYNVGDTPFSTPEMEEDAKKNHVFFKKILAKNVKPGDVVIVNEGVGYGSNGHTAIIDGHYRGRHTQIIEIGGIKPNGPVHRSVIGESFASLLKAGRITYARPVKNNWKNS
ncbi:NlpC/P60 family protein [Lactobacillus ultunensis]|uniref:NlpC/P60 domain-containing protein n=1 Tax=Lactobacillus ultunensis DSM 16047 TaxID=525365 RepID=C2ENG5_9LACO|nr:NlpC/P60 family protein [Lactobacillus ultunensis]EEJ71969.1 hypothetical protein HMPREF0548_1211 [Lactobacillus ultunensis DSM 16047]